MHISICLAEVIVKRSQTTHAHNLNQHSVVIVFLICLHQFGSCDRLDLHIRSAVRNIWLKLYEKKKEERRWGNVNVTSRLLYPPTTTPQYKCRHIHTLLNNCLHKQLPWIRPTLNPVRSGTTKSRSL